MIKKIDHIGIMTNDLDQSVDFYTDVLGFSIFSRIEMAEAGLSAVFVEKNGSKIELMKCRGKNIPKRSEGVKLKIGEGGCISFRANTTGGGYETCLLERPERGADRTGRTSSVIEISIPTEQFSFFIS